MDKSEAQIRNEEIVRKVMAERGYDRTPVKQKKPKTFKKPLIVSGAMVLILAVVVAVVVVVINNRGNEGNGRADNSGYAREKVEEEEEKTEETTEAGSESAPVSEEDTQYTPSADDAYGDLNVYHDYTDESGVQHYTDGSTFDPHHCDAQQAKYDAANQEIDRLDAAWTETFNNQTPFSELYEMAGRNMALATQWMEAEQKAVDDAMDALKAAQATANAIYWDEIVPCEKEMYGI